MTESVGKDEVSVQTPFVDYSQLGRKVKLYHTHPNDSDPEAPARHEQIRKLERFRQEFELGQVDEKLVDYITQKHIHVCCALPGQEDIMCMKREVGTTRSEITFGIATPRGITDIEIEFRTQISYGDLSFLLPLSLQCIDDQYFGQTLSDGEYMQKVIEDMDRQLSELESGKFRMGFRPISA